MSDIEGENLKPISSEHWRSFRLLIFACELWHETGAGTKRRLILRWRSWAPPYFHPSYSVEKCVYEC